MAPTVAWRLIASRLTVVLVFATLAACMSQRSQPENVPGPVPPSSKTSIDSAKESNLTTNIYRAGNVRYGLRLLSRIQALSIDSTPRVDSIQVAGTISVLFTTSSGQGFTNVMLQADSLTLTVGSGTSVPQLSGQPLIFSINSQTGQIQPNTVVVVRDCARDSVQIPVTGAEVLPVIHLPLVNRWVDTSQAEICRGTVKLIVQRVSAFEADTTEKPVSRIFRLTTVSVTGSGSQWGQHVLVAGRGTANDTLVISPSLHRVQQMSGSSQLKLQFQSPLRTQDFLQTTNTQVVLRRN